MEHENRWKHLEEHLLAHLGRVGLADLHELWLRDVCERVLNSMYRLRLDEELGCYSPGHVYGLKGGKADLNVEFE